MSKWIKKGDRIVVIAGNEKGKTGTVLSRTVDRVLVEGLNMRKKHMKPNQENPKGQILEREASLHISNVSLCNAEGERVKVQVRLTQEKKELVYHEGNKEIILRPLRQR
ncbi:MAG: 50S ribosomal protein L24 [Verrucomicrobia bacterium]|nr:50S ribosomal protein L24 [Verrucomicrobiota bacterium]